MLTVSVVCKIIIILNNIFSDEAQKVIEGVVLVGLMICLEGIYQFLLDVLSLVAPVS